MSVTERDVLLRAILADPADDAPRLIFADWLDEQGQPERAHFIRLSIQLCLREPGADAFSRALDRDVRVLQDISWSGMNREWHEGGLSISTWDRGFVSGIQCPTRTFVSRAQSIFHRQPITDVFLNDRQPRLESGFWGWMQEIDSHLPRRHVDEGAHSVPRCLMVPYLCETRLAPTNLREEAYYLSPELALAALSNACVAYGRKLAGLPPLAPRAA